MNFTPNLSEAEREEIRKKITEAGDATRWDGRLLTLAEEYSGLISFILIKILEFTFYLPPQVQPYWLSPDLEQICYVKIAPDVAKLLFVVCIFLVHRRIPDSIDLTKEKLREWFCSQKES